MAEMEAQAVCSVTETGNLCRMPPDPALSRSSLLPTHAEPGSSGQPWDLGALPRPGHTRIRAAEVRLSVLT